MRYIALLCLAACGGPFETSHHLAPDEGGSGKETGHVSPEGGKDARGSEAAPPLDAPVPPVDAGPDAPPPPVDAGHDTSPTFDASCPPPTITYPVVYGVTSVSEYGIYLPGGGTTTGSPTPAACRCAPTYNCICLEENAPSLVSLCIDPAFPHFNSCYMDGTVPVISCY